MGKYSLIDLLGLKFSKIIELVTVTQSLVYAMMSDICTYVYGKPKHALLCSMTDGDDTCG